MTNNQTNTLNCSYQIDEYKECFGRRCTNAGTNNLKIKYIKKYGWFCNTCKQHLQKEDLVESTTCEKVENGDES